MVSEANQYDYIVVILFNTIANHNVDTWPPYLSNNSAGSMYSVIVDFVTNLVMGLLPPVGQLLQKQFSLDFLSCPVTQPCFHYLPGSW